MDKSQCLDPGIAFKNFDNFVDCFYKWSDKTIDGSLEAAIIDAQSNNTFGHVITTCITKYCERPDKDIGGCGYSGPLLGAYEIMLQPDVIFMSDGCLGLNSDVNSDIAGPGVRCFSYWFHSDLKLTQSKVSTSYIIQVGIILYIWLAMRLLRILPTVWDFFTRLPYATMKNARSKERKTYLAHKLKEHSAVLCHVLVEFQEAQCFFFIAIGIATLISMDGSSSLFDAGNLDQIKVNLNLVRIISLGAIVPITLGILLLYEADMHSWYIWFWSTITVVLSIAMFYKSSSGVTFKKDFEYPQENSGVAECGNKPPPMVWCNSNRPPLASSVLTSLHSISLFIFVGLALVQLWLWGKRIFQRKLALTGQRRTSRFLSLPGWAKLTLKILCAVTELALAAIVTFYAFVLLSWAIFYTSEWTVGQLISVFIWAPAIFKYANWSFCAFFAFSLFLSLLDPLLTAPVGTESYSATRIAAPYRITNMGYVLGHRSTDGDCDVELGQNSTTTPITPLFISSISNRYCRVTGQSHRGGNYQDPDILSSSNREAER